MMPAIVKKMSPLNNNKPLKKIIFPSKPTVSLSLSQFLQNPTGPNSSFVSSRERIRKDLEFRFGRLLRENGGKLEFKVFSIKDTYLFYFKVPSESFGKELYYDVCLEFSPIDKSSLDDTRINNYFLKLFSNSPNFTFTYTYVINKMGLLIDNLKNKCNLTALKNPPVMRNPVESLGFEKSCYFAALYLRDFGFTSKLKFKNYEVSWNKGLFLNSIQSDLQKLKKYELLKKKKAQLKKIEKEKKRLEKTKLASKNKKSKVIHNTSKRTKIKK